MRKSAKSPTGLLAVLALVALLAGVVAAGPASGDPVAGTAKKAKCKKKGKKASSAKKKKCKKKKKAVPAPAPTVRATLTWVADGEPANLDLFVFDANGTSGNPASNSLVGTTFSANATANGTETFTDNQFLAGSGRTFGFGVCYGQPDLGSNHARGTLDYVTADGAHHVEQIDIGAQGGHVEFANGVPIPADYCN